VTPAEIRLGLTQELLDVLKRREVAAMLDSLQNCNRDLVLQVAEHEAVRVQSLFLRFHTNCV